MFAWVDGGLMRETGSTGEIHGHQRRTTDHMGV